MPGKDSGRRARSLRYMENPNRGTSKESRFDRSLLRRRAGEVFELAAQRVKRGAEAGPVAGFEVL